MTRRFLFPALLVLTACGSETPTPTAASAVTTTTAPASVATTTPATTTTTLPPSAGRNGAPTVIISDYQPKGPALAGVTAVTFAVTTSDPDHDALTLVWEFGDGATETTTDATSHTYNRAGTYHVTVTAKDGKGGEGAASIDIGVLNMTDTWHGAVANPPIRLYGSVSQIGRSIEGDLGNGVSISGRLSDPRDVRLEVRGLCEFPLVFRGSVDEGLDSFTLTTNDTCPQYSQMTLNRYR